MKMVELGEVATIDRESIIASGIRSGTKYLGLENVYSDGSSGPVNVDEGELLSNKFVFGPNHLLYGKLRPYLNKITLPDFDGICSTDIIPILPDPIKLDKRYLYYYLRTPWMIEHAVKCCSGANLPRVDPKLLAKFKIPLPPLPTQRRIAAILDKAQALVANDRRTLAVYDQLAKSLFLEMFGDPVRNERGWEVVTIGDLVDYMTSGSRGWAKYYVDEGETFLRIQNVRRDVLLLDDLTFVNAPDNAEAKRTCVRDGDVVVSITADLGRSAAIPKGFGTAYINQHLAILRLKKKVDPEYLSGYLATDAGAIQFARVNKGGVKAGLNFNDLRSIEVPLPPLELQKRYTKLKLQTRGDRKKIESSLHRSEGLFGSLLQGAFRGGLK